MLKQEGFALQEGAAFVPYPGTETGVPLLSSFYFRFVPLQFPALRVDNQIRSIAVLPGGKSVDLSPNADLSPLNVADGTLGIQYADKKSNSVFDRYFYKVAHSTLPFANVRRFQFRDVGCVGKCEQPLPRPPGTQDQDFDDLFVLCGFNMFFTNGDHDMDTLAVYEDNGRLTVEFNDQNDDDTFVYFVDYALVNRLAHNVQLGEESGTARGGARVPLLQGNKFIRGFRFDFRSGDHPLRDVGVLLGNKNLEVYYGDENADDQFRWFVRWANISPLVLHQ